jgi:hypothetical protein
MTTATSQQRESGQERQGVEFREEEFIQLALRRVLK